MYSSLICHFNLPWPNSDYKIPLIVNFHLLLIAHPADNHLWSCTSRLSTIWSLSFPLSLPMVPGNRHACCGRPDSGPGHHLMFLLLRARPPQWATPMSDTQHLLYMICCIVLSVGVGFANQEVQQHSNINRHLRFYNYWEIKCKSHPWLKKNVSYCHIIIKHVITSVIIQSQHHLTQVDQNLSKIHSRNGTATKDWLLLPSLPLFHMSTWPGKSSSSKEKFYLDEYDQGRQDLARHCTIKPELFSLWVSSFFWFTFQQSIGMPEKLGSMIFRQKSKSFCSHRIYSLVGEMDT